MSQRSKIFVDAKNVEIKIIKACKQARKDYKNIYIQNKKLLSLIIVIRQTNPTAILTILMSGR